jgi:hypothetical protein
MTIKTQGGKVITKDGKVSCECCEEPPGECCLYPAQALRDELYTVSDLPDSLIIVSGDFQQEMTKTEGFSPAYQGTNSEIFLTEVTEGNPAFWDIYYNPGAGGDILSFGQSCLVDGIYVKDQFADTYTVTSCSEPSAIGTILTRTSLCYWEGQYNTPFAGTQTVSIFYCPSVGPTPSDVCNDTFKFYSFYSRDVGGLTDPIIAEKTPHSNTPSGNYTAENGSISFA